MAISEESCHHLFQRLEEVLGPAEATVPMEHLPPVGWADVATKRDLDVLENRMDVRFDLMEERFARHEERFAGRFELMEERLTQMDRRLERLERKTPDASKLQRRDLPPFGSIISMAKEKATITLDRRKVEEARILVGAESTSAVVDVALDRLIQLERLRRDIAAYRTNPPADEELALAELAGEGLLDDDTDWAALYGDT